MMNTVHISIRYVVFIVRNKRWRCLRVGVDMQPCHSALITPQKGIRYLNTRRALTQEFTANKYMENLRRRHG